MMGPYYRGTSHGTGAFFETFYEHPILIGLFVLATVGIGAYLWFRAQWKKDIE
ncbi:MAG: hypothetical protein WCG11_07030 [Methylococcaceae bacterium]|jgi:hypothetical protein|nr:hypothetical protein [Methylococcales bacterium]MCX7075793.1 hypothetical protein [Methylococcales bacterium]